ncbi:MAG: hypothetical protein ACERKV_08430 [Clostridiaceae bacterium]
MVTLLKDITLIINDIHDLLTTIFSHLGFYLSDKALHFIIIGIIGMIIFFISDLIFKKLSKLSISVISFFYTFTVLLVIVFGIEIEQKITGRGNMEFVDILFGLWGFFVLFLIYLIIVLIIYLIKQATKKHKTKKNRRL